MFAAIALSKLDDPNAVEGLLQMLRVNDNHDPYLRYAAVTGLAGINDRTALYANREDPSPAVRLGILQICKKISLNPLSKLRWINILK